MPIGRLDLAPKMYSYLDTKTPQTFVGDERIMLKLNNMCLFNTWFVAHYITKYQ